jgi:hypothetical protein
MKNNYHHNLKFKQTTFKSQKNKDTSTNTKEINPGFHSLSCFLSSIGKLWADGGLRDLLVDSGVYAGNTAELMLVGKEFNRDVRGFTLI